ncbi:hypothetical protein HG536_0A02400 [Torulaspora globosa]|uniref:Prenyltransferase alpha-alpha toroid domain-containing protein n=1 Tax=Torulaspora globosa TaxID=48254 RepID=A0A7G3ZA87_9SACH|nr:uncharacterized protein HG536_0A02400 [Torulaspora globosa]QLL30423.1 hypothetical protein HG536_0A02400 [Torulaspora globosa]
MASIPNHAKHVRFLERHLSLLPGSQQEHDVNKMAVVFYSFTGLMALGIDVAEKYRSSLDWIHRHYITIKLPGWQQTISGFTGSLSVQIPGVNTVSLPNTLFALLVLKLMKDETFWDNHLDRQNIMTFVAKCQSPENGSFSSTLDYKNLKPSPVDPKDLRFCYIAISILYLLGCRNHNEFARHINLDKLLNYILSQQCEMGGFGSYNEAHAGYTSCALSALYLLGKLDQLSDEFKERTISWLCQRQVSREGCMSLLEPNANYDHDDHGGFQGRENKFADTCYVFWCLNSLRILGTQGCELPARLDLAEQFLLHRTQNTLIGGFSKNDQDDPDLYHTCLGIAALKLIEGSFDGVLFMPKNDAGLC